MDQAQAKLNSIAQAASEIARLAAAVEEEPAFEAEPALEAASALEAEAASHAEAEHASAPEQWPASEHAHEVPVLSAWDAEPTEGDPWAGSHASSGDPALDPLGVLASLRHAVDTASG
jgi:hypothetical protein